MRLSILLPLITILLASCASAEGITTAKQEYLLGETVQAEVSMQNFDISKLSFTDNRSNKIAAGFLTQAVSDRNFVYFNIPSTINQGEYFLKAKDQRIINGVLGDFEISANINVLSDTGISIDPAIILLDPMKNEFKILVKNNAQKSYDVNITALQMKATRETLQIAPGETKNAYISYDISKLEGEQSIQLSYANRSYTVRVLVPEKKIIEAAQPKELTQTETAELKFIGPETVEKKASTYTSFSDQITVKSTAKTELKNIRFSLTGSLSKIATIKLQAADKIAPEGSIDQYIWINKDKKAAPGNYEGNLVVEAEGGYRDEIAFKISLEELKLVEEKPVAKPNITAFNQSRLAMILNETRAKEEPNTVKNVTIALSMLLIVASIAALIALRLRNNVQKKPLEEYVKGLKKGKK